MVESGLISYCARQARDGTPKDRRLAEAAVCILKLAPQQPSVRGRSVEQVITELYPGYLDPRKGGANQTVSFLTTSTKNKINEENLKKRQEQLLEVSVSMALAFLQTGRHSHALLAAEQYLVLAADVFSSNDLRLIPAYCLLAEICIGLNKLREGEQHLQKANWVVHRNQDAENINQVNARLYRSFGLVQAAKGNNEEALRLFAEQVYFSSLVGGTESIGAANGYFNLANVLAREPSNQKQALSLYHKCATCWLKIIEIDQLTLTEAEIGETANMLTTTAEVISESDSEFSLIAAALRVAYLSKMNFPQAKDERQKVLNSTQAKDLDETVKILLEM